MLRHIFLADVRAGVPDDAVDALLAAWRRFPAAIPEIRALSVGRNVSTEDRRYAVVLVADFDDAGAWRRFMDHPAHLDVRHSISEVVLDLETRVMLQYVL